MSDVIVRTTTGLVRGYERKGHEEFLGIPYAEAPVGELRFRRCVPKKPWEGVFDAKEYGPVPVQMEGGVKKGSEDCLFVNVKRPLRAGDCPGRAGNQTAEGAGAGMQETGAGSGSQTAGSGKLPVFVYIYGGGYNIGAASDPLYWGDSFVDDGLIYVSFQYRLNVFGFYDFTTFPGGDLFDSNCGLSDQLTAMHWIRDNIEGFGGDPERITICGESAGGASVVNLLAAPAAKGTFTQAIAESSLPNCVMTHQTARENIMIFLEGMHYTEEDVPKLKSVDAYDVLDANELVQQRGQYRNPGMFLPGPVQDDLLPVRPIEAIRAGSAADVKLIIGTTKHEGTTFVHPENTGFPNSWDMIEEMFEKNGHADAYPAVKAYYEQCRDPFVQFATDYAFKMPAIKVAEAQLEHTRDVWMYRYDHVTKSGFESGMGATHACELPAVFRVMKNHPWSDFIFAGEDEADVRAICDEVHGNWVSFAKTGHPAAEDWARCSGRNSIGRFFNRKSGTEQFNRTDLMALWGDMRFYES